MTKLAILVSGEHVADVEQSGSGPITLVYRADTSVSLSMPAAIGSYRGQRVQRWLRGLIPDDAQILSSLQRQRGVGPNDLLGLLRLIGKDCAGAIQFCDPDDIEATIHRDGRLVAMSDAEIEYRLAALQFDSAESWVMPDEHWSLGGSQPKVALRRIGDRWFTAQGNEPTTHILKPGIRRLPYQALAEYVSMATAARLGLDVAEVAYTSFISHDALVVTRFDRRYDGGGQVARLHQEDLCQAMGEVSKFEEQGGPSAVDIVRFLRSRSSTSAQAQTNVDRFVTGLIYNTVIGAPDAHARNYAVLLNPDGPRLAPLFDVATGLGYTMSAWQDRKMAMSIGGTFVLDQIDAAAWIRFAADARLDASSVLEQVRSLSARVVDRMERVFADAAYDGADALRERVLPALSAHVRRLGAV